MRAAVFGIVSLLLGCDGSVVDPDGAGGSGGSGGNSETSSTTSSAGDAGGGGSGATVPPGQTYSTIECDEEDQAMLLFVEIWPEAAGECLPDPGTADVLVLAIDAWDGAPGTFVVGEETPAGTAQATFTTGPDSIPGTITVEPFIDTPGWISWDLETDVGRTDLSVCGKFDAFPCPR